MGMYASILRFSCCCFIYFSFLSELALAKPDLTLYSKPPSTSMVSVSPSGERVAFRKQKGGSDVIQVFSLKEKKLLAAYDVSELEPNGLTFLSESKLILYATENKRVTGYRDRFDVSTALLLNLEDKSIEQLLTPGDNIIVGQTGLGDIVGVSDNRRYVYMPAFSQSKSLYGQSFLSLMKVDVDSPKKPTLVKKGHKDAKDYFIDGNGELLARELRNDLNNLHRVQSMQNGKWKTIYEERLKLTEYAFVGLSPDYTSLVVLYQPKNEEAEHYRLMSLKDGSISDLPYHRDKKNIDRVYKTIGRVVTGLRYSGFHPSYLFFDEALQQRVETIVNQFEGNSVRVYPAGGNWEHIVAHVSGTSSSGDYYLFSKGKKGVFLTSSRPDIKNEHVHPIIQTTISASDDLTIPVLLTIPLDHVDSLNNLPAVMFPHGGPESYNQIGFNYKAQAMANEGFVVIQPQFRGSSGFGHSFKMSGRGQWGKKMQDDLTDTLNAFVKEKLIDPDRVCIAGASYGGYAALAGGAFTPELYRCVVSINGVSDVQMMLKQEKRDHGRKSWVHDYWETVIKNEGELKWDDLASISPARNADKFKVPVLLIHGEDDETVNFKQSSHMKKYLKRNNKDVRLVRLKKETHYLENEKTREQALKEMLRFIKSHIGK